MSFRVLFFIVPVLKLLLRLTIFYRSIYFLLLRICTSERHSSFRFFIYFFQSTPSCLIIMCCAFPTWGPICRDINLSIFFHIASNNTDLKRIFNNPCLKYEFCLSLLGVLICMLIVGLLCTVFNKFESCCN